MAQNELDQASDQLANSFARLESVIQQALQATKPAASGEGADYGQEIASLQEENLNLREEYAALNKRYQDLQQEYDELVQRNEHIASQIDRQVEQLELMA